MLIDDDEDDNFFHETAIIDNDLAEIVVVKNSAKDALDYLKAKVTPLSDLIFLDINMPGMTGWDFLAEYNKLDKEVHRNTIIVMLSTSTNPRDIEKSKTWSFVSDYITKPLTKASAERIIKKFFKG